MYEVVFQNIKTNLLKIRNNFRIKINIQSFEKGRKYLNAKNENEQNLGIIFSDTHKIYLVNIKTNNGKCTIQIIMMYVLWNR